MTANGGKVLRRSALVVVLLALVGVTTGFAVSAGFESSRADRFDRATVGESRRTSQLRARKSDLEKRLQSSERLQQRLEHDVDVLRTIDHSAMKAYSDVAVSLDDLSSAVNDLVDHNVPGNPRDRIDPLLAQARGQLAAFAQAMGRFSRDRSAIRADVRASGRP